MRIELETFAIPVRCLSNLANLTLACMIRSSCQYYQVRLNYVKTRIPECTVSMLVACSMQMNDYPTQMVDGVMTQTLTPRSILQ